MEINDNHEMALNKVPLPLPKHGCLKWGITNISTIYESNKKKL